ncbi:MAG: putative Ig domain-containing protein, partial [Gammaproteobacteria bacterium]|nr:putative Ig domain-containing protein [Gammaproteobacteria bacterium]
PTVTIPANQSNAEGDAVQLAIVASDADGDTLTYSATGLPKDLVLDSTAGVIHGSLNYTSAGEYFVSVTVSDGLNKVTINFNWFVSNTNRAPTIVTPANQVNSIGDVVNLAINSSDPDGDSLSYSVTGLPTGLGFDAINGAIAGIVDSTQTPPPATQLYNIVLTVSDGVVSISVTFQWTVNYIVSDTTPPVVTAPSNIEVEAVDNLTPVDIGVAVATDDIDGVLQPTASNTGPFDLGVTVVIWTAVDAAGNLGMAEQLVSVVDTTPPVLTTPPRITAQTTTPDGISIDIGQSTAMDIFPVTITNDAPTTFFAGSTLVTWTAVDTSGNTTTGTQLVSVVGPNTPTVQTDYTFLAADVSVAGKDSSDAVVLFDKVIFVGEDAANGRELFVHSSSTGATSLLIDVVPGVASSNPHSLTIIDGALFFIAEDGIGGKSLWRTDGNTLSGSTVKLGSVPVTSQYITVVANTLQVTPFKLTVIGSQAYFVGNDGQNGNELWMFDGLNSGMVADIAPGIASSSPTNLAAVGNQLFFAANDGVNGFELWVSDGTALGTKMVKDIYPGLNGSNVSYPTAWGNTLYFTASNGANGYELWKSDGTAAGTVLVKDINAGSNNSFVSYTTLINNRLYFAAVDGINGAELWTSDGTSMGTVMVKDIWSGAGSSVPNNIVNVAGQAYFVADNGIHGRELWTSNGTEEGTRQVSDLNIGALSSLPALNQDGVVQNWLYFIADNGVDGRELWLTYFGLSALIDSDGDGMDDRWEFDYFKDLSSTVTSDSDDDGLIDVREFQSKANPTLGDSDFDGLGDLYEANNYLDPNFDDTGLDFDQDNLSNLFESGIGSLPYLSDSDGDGAADDQELQLGNDPLNLIDVPV